MPLRARRVPDVVIKRLPAYLRVLEELDAVETPIVSSQDLGRRAGVSPGQVRKDLTNFGVFGKQGVGYRAAVLREEIRKILRLDNLVPVALVGAGHLGLAVARYDLQRERLFPGGTRLVAIFDQDLEKVGAHIGDLRVRHVNELEEILAALKVKIIILAVPAGEAQSVVSRAIAAGIKAILNFAPVSLEVPPGVTVHTADMGSELEALAYYA